MILAVFVLFFISSCYCGVDFNERPRNFSIELLYHTQSQTEGHVVISPFGIWTLLTGVALGTNGECYRQLSSAFIFPRKRDDLIQGYKKLTSTVLSQSTSDVSLRSSNFVFLDNSFEVYQDFRTSLRRDFGATFRVMDFQDSNTVQIANSFIQNSGSGVSNVLSSDDFEDAKMILINVISFKGLWASPFNKTNTAVEPFYNENREVVGNVNMMFQKAEFPFSNMKPLKAYVLELPYGTDGKYSMLFLLPYGNVKIVDMYKNFANVRLSDVFKKLKADQDNFGFEDVMVKIPRFQIKTNVVLNKPLNDMGVFDIFQPDSLCFQLVTKENIFVSAIVHKAEIEVTESGTVASASTSAKFSNRMGPPTFTANRPFAYFLIDKPTLTVIFSGIYSKPTVY